MRAAPPSPAPRHARRRPACWCTRECIQLHGGIGYTDQYDVGLYLRKAMVMANQYGSATLHRRRFMATSPESRGMSETDQHGIDRASARAASSSSPIDQPARRNALAMPLRTR
jgi:hypothetical protein